MKTLWFHRPTKLHKLKHENWGRLCGAFVAEEIGWWSQRAAQGLWINANIVNPPKENFSFLSAVGSKDPSWETETNMVRPVGRGPGFAELTAPNPWFFPTFQVRVSRSQRCNSSSPSPPSPRLLFSSTSVPARRRSSYRELQTLWAGPGHEQIEFQKRMSERMPE